MEEVLRLEELVEEILIRLPPDDPPSLVRAATVCRRWCCVISDPGFRRQFVRHNRAAPVLGFLANLRDGGGLEYDPYDDELYGQEYDFVARFVPTTPFRPIFPDIADNRDRCALDARHGRVLLTTTPWGSDLEVWDPISDMLWVVPALPPALGHPFSWNAAVLCGHHGACDHCDCNLGPFAVVLLDSDTEMMRVHIYLSEIEAWSEPSYGPPSPIDGVEELPTALVGNALYFLICASHSILEFDLATWNMSVIPLLPEDDDVEFTVLVTMGDGHLGFARIHDSRLLFIWSMETDPLGHAQWALTAILELEALLPVDAFPILNHFLGFAHGIGVFFVPTQDERSILTIDVSSYQVRREDCGDGRTHSVVPYTGFYTPGANFLSS
ncbi:hypothetical protein HU200_013676 [Digitaria exilis]|uniref:F-box domain-containing protein n=1 Tax=Digitaria exilis TaxID=1010633 RepID=A0A835FCV5_9POAL|nr:hypothetical protein HU200_013676 [Digitaria exilis]